MSTVRVALAQALSSIRGNPLRASLAGLAMAAAVAAARHITRAVFTASPA